MRVPLAVPTLVLLLLLVLGCSTPATPSPNPTPTSTPAPIVDAQVREAAAHVLRAIDRLDALRASLASAPPGVENQQAVWGKMYDTAMEEIEWLSSQPQDVHYYSLIHSASLVLMRVETATHAVYDYFVPYDYGRLPAALGEAYQALQVLDGMRPQLSQLASPPTQ